MANTSLFITLFSKWPKTRRSRVYFWRIIGLVAGIVLFSWIFVLYNRIPTKTVDLDVTGYAVTDAEVDLLLSLGRNTSLTDRFDSTYRKAFGKSGREGLTADIEASGDYYPLYDEELPLGGKIRDYFPEEKSGLEHISSMIRFRTRIDDVHRKLMMFGTTQRLRTGTIAKDYTVDEEQKRAYFIHGDKVTRHWSEDIVRYESDDCVLFRDTLELIPSAESINRRQTFFRNRSIWQASDISQSYVGIHLSKTLHQCYKRDLEGYAERNPDRMRLTLAVDFGSPVTLSNMEPEPDALSLTGMSFLSKDKIDAIMRDGLVFHVTYDENKNLQAVKVFWITTIIAALVGVLLNQVFKWWHFLAQKRKLEKRRRENNTGSVG